MHARLTLDSERMNTLTSADFPTVTCNIDTEEGGEE